MPQQTGKVPELAIKVCHNFLSYLPLRIGISQSSILQCAASDAAPTHSLCANISLPNRQVVSGLSYGVAISIALARIIVRLHINKGLPISKRLQLDDWLLLFGCASLTAATILLLYAIPTVYLIEATSLNPIVGLFGDGGSGVTNLDTLLSKINFFARFNWTYLILSWTTIFAVKAGFLSFFRNLVLRLPGIHQYWRIVVAVTVIVYLFALIDGVIACPHDGLIARMY